MTTRFRTAAVAFAGVALLSATVFAHMKLVKSLPAADATVGAAPAKVQIWFTEAPDRAVSKLTVSGPGGAVKVGAIAVEADKSMSAAVEGTLGDGAYTVEWQSAGGDGHVQKGTFGFSVRRTQ